MTKLGCMLSFESISVPSSDMWRILRKIFLKTLEISKNSNTWDKRISWAPASEIGCMESLPWPFIATNLRDSLTHISNFICREIQSLPENLWGFLQSKFCVDQIQTWKVWKKMSEDCYDQSFFVSLYLKLVKFDEEIFKFVSIKSFEFDWMKISKSFIWKSLRSNCNQVFVFDIMQTSKSWIFKKVGVKPLRSLWCPTYQRFRLDRLRWCDLNDHCALLLTQFSTWLHNPSELDKQEYDTWIF